MDAETDLSRALENYRLAYQATLDSASLDEAGLAKQLVSKARRIVRDGGISRALLKILLPEMRHWPAWCRLPEFRQHVHFAAEDVVAVQSEPSPQETRIDVSFAYKGERYSIVFVDLGWNHLAEEIFHHGKVEFHAEGELVLGLDVADDMDIECPRWSDFGLYAFRAGGWMKFLVEMATDIEAVRHKGLERNRSAEALAQASNIKLPAPNQDGLINL